MALTAKQRGVLKGIVLAVIIVGLVFVAAFFVSPLSLPRQMTMAERITFSLKADLLVMFWLLFSIGRLARHRFLTPEDIDGGGLSPGSNKANILQATLQNTMEQAVLAVFIHTLWAVVMPLRFLAIIPAAALLFLCGRVLFVNGYTKGAPSRALGFALTFYPSILMFLIIVIYVV